MTLRPQTVNFDEKWKEIKDTVNTVLTMSAIKPKHWNDRFSDIYQLCIASPEPLADQLYLQTKLLLEDHVRQLFEEINALSDANLLSGYYTHWVQFSKGAEYLNSLYSYLNGQHINRNKMTEADITYGALSIDLSEKQLVIGELGLEIWQREMIMKCKKRLVGVLLACFEQDRSGNTTNVPTSTIRGVISSFVDVNKFKSKATMQLYEEVFEEDLINATGEFYRSEAAAILQKYDISTYMEKVLARAEDEKLRATKFLPPISHLRIAKEVQSRMAADHLNTLHGEASHMISQESTKDLGNMYKLLHNIPGGIIPLVKYLQEHIKLKGLESVLNLKGDNVPNQYVENLLKVHGRYKTLIGNLFNNDQHFVGALDKAFEAIVNHRQANKQISRSPELLAKYCDGLLKKSTKGFNESEVDDKLSRSITLFKYIDDKDVYQKFYARLLARRLIHQQSHSMDSEEAMINKLKQACGYEYTSKLHRMFTDVSVSAGHNEKFQQYLQNQNQDLGINFNIFVLQAGAWPLGQTAVTPFAVPQELERSVQAFEAFYHRHFSGRKLTWLHHLCQAELKVNHTKRTYLISMSSFQMAMMLMFEKVDSVTCSMLQENIGLNEEQFTKFLQSLIDSKLLSTESEELKGDASINLNLEFTNKRTKFKIAVANVKETQQEIEQTHTAVDEDRKLYLQAAIVRIMKARKVLKHNLLIQEVITQSKSRFTPHIPMIKKCIEVLIDKQYIERSNKSTDEYSYVA